MALVEGAVRSAASSTSISIGIPSCDRDGRAALQTELSQELNALRTPNWNVRMNHVDEAMDA